MRERGIWMGAALVALVALVAGFGGGPPPADAAPIAPDPPGTRSVTLVTGDRVLTGSSGAGGVRVRPGPGREGMRFSVSVEHGHLYVVPGDMLARTSSGRVDRRLFDVTALRAGGHDGAPTSGRIGAPATRPEVKSHNVTLRHIDRAGGATPNYRVRVGSYGEPVDVHPYDPGGTVTFPLPAGRYLITSWIGEPDGQQSMVVQPWIDLTSGDVTITVDARKAAPVDISVPDESTTMMMGLVQYQAGPESSIVGGVIGDGGLDGVYVAHLGAEAPADQFAATATAHFAEPGPDGDFADSPTRYNVAHCRYGRMWDGLVRRPGAADFTAIKPRDLHPGPANRALLGISGAPGTGVPGPVLWDFPIAFRPDAHRTEYFAGDGVRWWQNYQRFAVVGEELTELTAEHATWQPITAGARGPRWAAAVVGPALPGGDSPRPPAERSGDVLHFRIPMFSAGAPRMAGVSPVTAARTVLYREGAVVGESDEAGYGDFPVPARAATYRLHTHAVRDVSDLSTTVDAAWTFRSAPVAKPGGEALPLLVVRFEPRLDPRDRAPAETVFDLPVRVEWLRPGRPAVTRMEIDVSYDDGAHWRPATLTGHPGGWTARLTHPPVADGHVSLRARATDSLGSTVEQTVIRAYGLAGR